MHHNYQHETAARKRGDGEGGVGKQADEVNRAAPTETATTVLDKRAADVGAL